MNYLGMGTGCRESLLFLFWFAGIFPRWVQAELELGNFGLFRMDFLNIYEIFEKYEIIFFLRRFYSIFFGYSF